MIPNSQHLSRFQQQVGSSGSANEEQVKTLRARVKAGEKRAALAREFKISPETVYQYAPVKA